MKSFIKFLIPAILVINAGYIYAKPAAANAVTANTEDRHLSGFNAVNVAGSFDVYFEQGSAESVKVEAPEDIIGHIITEVNGGVLKIYNKHDVNFQWGDWFGGHHKKIAIYVTAKDLNSISVSGSGDVYFKEGITTDRLKINVSGSGDILGKVSVKTLETRISGSGDVKISGSAESSAVSINGSGDFTARNLLTANTSIRVSGSGDAEVNVSNSLNASVSGSGDIRYTGNAKNISTAKSGSGDIDRY